MTTTSFPRPARARRLEDPTVLEVANEVGATAAQELVAFSLTNGFVALPKSANLKANLYCRSFMR
jgi:diketogulonate reductase-like aldo/keto reductase